VEKNADGTFGTRCGTVSTKKPKGDKTDKPATTKGNSVLPKE
jgi:hypothetical protein